MSNNQTQEAWESWAIDHKQDRLEEFYQDENERGPVEAWQKFCILLESSGYPLPRPNNPWDLDKDRQGIFWWLLDGCVYGFDKWLEREFQNLPDGGEFDTTEEAQGLR